MRFLILTQYFPPEIGAAQVRLAAFARELARLGHHVEIASALPNYPTGRIFPAYRKRFYYRENWEGMTVHRVWVYPSVGRGFKRLANYLSFSCTALWGLAKAQKPDYLFVESPPLTLGIPAFLVAKRWKIPFIFNVSDLWPDVALELKLIRDGLTLRLAKRLEAWIYRQATFVNAITEGIRQALLQKKRLPPHKVLFLPNGVDIELFKPTPPDEELARQLGLEGRKIILYAGTHGYIHGLQTALQAAKRLETEESLFLFVGDGSEKSSLVQLARGMKLNNVRFLDPLPSEQVARLYSLAIAGLSVLRKESSAVVRPAKILACMAAGKPVLYSGSGEGACLVEEARAGLVVPPEDPQALAEAVRTLLRNPELGAELGQNGRRYVEERFSWRILVQNWLQQLETRSKAVTLQTQAEQALMTHDKG